jgi:hypothetical protein
MRLLTVISAVMLMGATAAVAQGEVAARNHGYETAALEVYCKGMLTVADATLRTRLDKLYRENPRWRKYFDEGYQDLVSYGQPADPQELWITCTNAGKAQWLTLEPAVREILTIIVKKREEEAKERRGPSR